MKKNSNYDKTIIFNGKFIKTYILKQNEKNGSSNSITDNPYREKIDGKIVYYKQYNIDSDKKICLDKPFKTIYSNYCSSSKKSIYPTISTNSETYIFNLTTEKLNININKIESSYGLNRTRKQSKINTQKPISKGNFKKMNMKECLKTISYFKNSEFYY